MSLFDAARLGLLMALMALVTVGHPPAVGAAPAPASEVSPAEAELVLRTIRQRTQRFHTHFSGIVDNRRTVVREYDSDTRKLVSSKQLLHGHRQLFDRRPELQIRRCTVDGERAPASRCASDDLRREPPLPVFTEAARRHFRVEVAGTTTVAGQRCYRLEVHPLKRTTRHFSGQMYFRAADLQLLMMEGTVAHLPFPVRRIYLKLWFQRAAEGVVGVSRGYVDVWVRVPLVFARRIVTRFSAAGHRPIPR